MDAIFFILWIATASAMVLHFFVGMPKGRFRKKWIEWKWPDHDHRAPFLPKLMHWVHLACMIALAASGLYIRFPTYAGWRTPMRYIHYVAMTIVLLNLFWRIWYAFFAKDRDWKKFAVGRRDMQSMGGVAMYYAYLSNSKPHVAEYNVMQKLTYLVFLGLMLLQGFTGLALLTQPILFGYSPREVLVGWWLGAMLGDVAIAGAWIRVVHYAINWLFIIITTVHFYLALNEDLLISLDFFGFKRYPDHLIEEAKAKAHAEHGDHGEHGAPVLAAEAE